RCPPRRRCPRGRCGRGDCGGSLDGGREELREVWLSCSCNVRTCSCKVWTMDVKVFTCPLSVSMYARTSGGIRSQSSCGKVGGVSMATEYAINRRGRKG